MLYKYGAKQGATITLDFHTIIGLVRISDDPTFRYHVILTFSRPLTDHEQDECELDYLGEVEE